jgi:2-polyprenyl-6-methoxyphenol hydroxylase-like FAD-dependent oxidoreductase
MRAMRALVIGCGIGGASVALALAEIGFDVEVYETTPRARDDHGWVTLGPSAMTGLDRLSVGDQVSVVGFPIVPFCLVQPLQQRHPDPDGRSTHHDRAAAGHAGARGAGHVLMGQRPDRALRA